MVRELNKENREMKDRLCDAAVIVEEQKAEVRTMKAEMEANASRNVDESDAMRDKLSRVESELVFYKFVFRCCVVFVLLAVWNKWFS
jgi:hypothetical protein